MHHHLSLTKGGRMLSQSLWIPAYFNDHQWLSEMYDLRHLWIPAYFNDHPMAGLLRTTSTSKNSNFYFNHFVQKGDTLSEFYLCYESAIDKQRHENYRMNHDDNGRPTFLTPKPIERDAANLYTLSMFYKVQEEIRGGCFEIQIQSLTVVEPVKIFSLKDELAKHKLFQVQVNTDMSDVVCSCHMYTHVGYLCKHAFFCLGMCGIDKIPRHLLKDRWMKNAEERFSTLQLGELSDLSPKEDRIRSKTRDCWFEFQACMSDVSVDEDLVDISYEAIKELRKKLADKRHRVSMRVDEDVIEQLIGSGTSEDITILPPKQSNNEESRKRIISSAEKIIGGKQRQKRECKNCGARDYHDSRNCPNKNQQKVKEQEQLKGQSDNILPPQQ